MSYIKNLTCKQCFNNYPIEPINVCELCFGPLEVTYDYEKISKSVTRNLISSVVNPFERIGYAEEK